MVDQGLAYYLGGYRLHKFAQRPAVDTRGGIMLLQNDDLIVVEAIQPEAYSLLAMIRVRECGTDCCLTIVYSPSRDRDKPAFLQKLKSPRPATNSRWLVLCDFNLIYRASDKNNTNISRARMG